ncbi:hypothetical protein [Chitinimonas sp. BJYL2]|uniref:hypothetical protein n=1 Tax=Chitinimonas sp. BJYL2 TaxID=2976696 RepID=UPI0022B5A873|nr:hypothetical protein [Chitinimonas sp. BJYL2]
MRSPLCLAVVLALTIPAQAADGPHHYDRAKPLRIEPNAPAQPPVAQPPARPQPPQTPPPQGRPPFERPPVVKPEHPGKGHIHGNRPDHRPPVVVQHPHGYWPNHGWYIGKRVRVLPPGHRTLWLGGAVYYVINDAYLQRDTDTYVVVPPPVVSAYREDEDDERDGDRELFAYPLKGQDDKQQALDRYECRRWAVRQTDFDPEEIPSGLRGQALEKAWDDLLRAERACLEGRGYSVQ